MFFDDLKKDCRFTVSLDLIDGKYFSPSGIFLFIKISWVTIRYSEERDVIERIRKNSHMRKQEEEFPR